MNAHAIRSTVTGPAAQAASGGSIAARLALAGATLFAAVTFAASAQAADNHVRLEFDSSCNAADQAIVTDAVGTAFDTLAVAIADVGAPNPAPFVTKAAEIFFGSSTDLQAIAVNFSRIAARLGPDAEPIRVSCHRARTDVFAWVPGEYCGAAGPAELHLGKPFFDAVPRDGYDSRMGTIIHEETHMAPGLAANCASDRDEKYDVDEVLLLGRLAPDYARSNAQNYEYFIETLYGN